MPPTRALTKTTASLLFAVALLFSFCVSLVHLDRESLWYDEGWTMWTVYDDANAPEGLREIFGYGLSSILDALARIRDWDVHPPLYYLSLDVWSWFTGEGVFTARLVSVWWGLLTLAATYLLGVKLFDRPTALIAVIILGTTSLYIYYTREARMYTALMGMSALSTWAYVCWREQPTVKRAGVYGLFMALTVYAQYIGVFVIIGHILHVVVTNLHRRWPRFREAWKVVLPYLIALAVFAPWLPSFILQVRLHPSGPLGVALPSNFDTIASLWLLLTSAAWGLFALPFVIGDAIPTFYRDASARQNILLLLIGVLLTPMVLFIANAVYLPLFQIRYNLAILPPAALIAAFGVRHLSIRSLWSRLPNVPQSLGMYIQPILIFVWIALISFAQLTIYTNLWTDKPRWKEAIQEVKQARSDTEPAFTLIPDNSVEAYYNRALGIRSGITIDLSWREFTPDDVRTLVNRLDNVPSVWAMLPINNVTSWDVVTALREGREVGWRSSVMNMIFYRFDLTDGATAGLRYQFGDLLAYDSDIGHQFYARPGDRFCTELRFTALHDIGDNFSAGLHLTQGYGVLRAQWDGGIGAHLAGDSFSLTSCMTIPQDSTRGPYHLRLAVYDWKTVQRLPVQEVAGDGPEYWWDFLLMGVVSVDTP